MRRHEVTHVAAPPEVVWDVIHNYQQRLDWDTMLRRLAVNGSDPAVGGPIMAGTVVTQWARWLAGGVRLSARYEVSEPPTSSSSGVAAIRMTQGPWFFADFSARSELFREPDGSTRCVATYEYHCRPRLLAGVVTPIVTFFFNRETTFRWRALKRFVEKRAERNRDSEPRSVAVPG